MQQLKRKNFSCTTVLPLCEFRAVYINSEINSTSSPLIIHTGSFIPSNDVLGILNSKPFLSVPENSHCVCQSNSVKLQSTNKLNFYLTFFVYMKVLKVGQICKPNKMFMIANK